MRRLGKSFSRSFGVYKGGVAPVLDATPVWQTAANLGSAPGNTSYTTTLVATSPVGGSVTYAFTQTGDYASFTLNTSTGGLSFNGPLPNKDTTYTIVVKALDSSGAKSATRTFTLTSTYAAQNDPYSTNVIGLYHFDSNFNDSSTNAFNFNNSLTGASGITSEDSKFGGSCMKFAGGYLWFPQSNILRFTDDFTIEFWLKTIGTQNSSSVISGASTSSSEGYEITNYFGANGATSGATNSGCWLPNGARTYNNAPVNNGVWHHHALVRSGSSVNYYIDGVAGTAATVPTTTAVDFGSTASMHWGGNATNSPTSVLNAYMDELRITKGVARYTANFTPATTAFLYP
jgi:hypothetical protein